MKPAAAALHRRCRWLSSPQYQAYNATPAPCARPHIKAAIDATIGPTVAEQQQLALRLFAACIADIALDKPDNPIVYLIDKLRAMPDDVSETPLDKLPPSGPAMLR